MPSVARVLHQGLAADKPSADAAVNQGWLYYETDTGQLKQSWNGAWVTVNAGAFANVTTKLDQQTVGGGGAANITFSGISAAYSRLRVEIVGASDTAASGSGLSYNAVLMTINGDTTDAHYRFMARYISDHADNTYEEATYAVATHELPVGVVADPRVEEANIPGRSVIDILDYANTQFGKVGQFWQGTNASTDYIVEARGAFWWNQLAAISSLVFKPQVGNFVEGTVARLYGYL